MWLWLKKCGTCLLALSLASCSLWAFPGRVTSSQVEGPTATVAAGLLEEEQPSRDSGTTSSDASTMPATSSPVASEAVAKAAEGDRLSAAEASALYDELVAISADVAALRQSSAEKDEELSTLQADNAALKSDLDKAEKETGSKAYIMLEGIVGVDNLLPTYGVGLTVGARVGNSLMLQLGVDYDINRAMDFSLDRWTFRAGIGWMF